MKCIFNGKKYVFIMTKYPPHIITDLCSKFSLDVSVLARKLQNFSSPGPVI